VGARPSQHLRDGVPRLGRARAAGPLQAAAARDVYDAAARRQDPDYFHMYAGQSAGLIHDLPGAADVVHAIVREARAVLDTLPGRLRTRREGREP
jgi:hypothetical protein